MLGLSSTDYKWYAKELFTNIVQYCSKHHFLGDDAHALFYKPDNTRSESYILDDEKINAAVEKLSVHPFPAYEQNQYWSIETIEDFRFRVEQLFVNYPDDWLLSKYYNRNVVAARTQDGTAVYYKFKKRSSAGILEPLEPKEPDDLRQRLSKDIAECDAAIRAHKAKMPPPQHRRSLYIAGDNKIWLDERIRLDTQKQQLTEISTKMQKWCKKTPLPPSPPIPDNSKVILPPLLLYKGNTRCHRDEHSIVSAEVVLYDGFDREATIKAEYCSTCKKYMLSFDMYNRYRERYGVLIGNYITEKKGGSISEMAQISPLMLSGYSVSQSNGLSAKQRQYLLAKLMYCDIMTRSDIMMYLNFFINMNGSKAANRYALEKWEADLEFVRRYNKSTDPSIFLEKSNQWFT